MNPKDPFLCRQLFRGAGLLLCLCGMLLPRPASAGAIAKDALLRNVVQKSIVPGYQDLNRRCQELVASMAALEIAPSSNGWQQAREAWVEVLLAARRMQWFQSGPIADREYVASFYYSKMLTARIDTVLKSSQPIEDGYLVGFGSNARGLFAMEYLLFDPKMETGSSSAGASTASRIAATRRIHYLLVLARDLQTKAAQLEADWTDIGEQATAAKFVAGGQQSVSLLVNQIAQLVEQTAENRLNFILVLPAPISRQVDRVEGHRSGTTQKSLRALLEGVQKLYSAGEVSSFQGFVKQINPALAERVKKQLESTLAAIKNLGGPLEEGVVKNRSLVKSAHEQVRSMEILFKVDVTSALGVTLTFSANDGD